MVLVTKKITRGASFYGQTDACGNIDYVKRTGIIACGSGDDHALTAFERVLVQSHDPSKGDLELPSGPLSTCRAAPIQ